MLTDVTGWVACQLRGRKIENCFFFFKQESNLGSSTPETDALTTRPTRRSSQTTDLKNGSMVATLPDIWRYRGSAGTGWGHPARRLALQGECWDWLGPPCQAPGVTGGVLGLVGATLPGAWRYRGSAGTGWGHPARRLAL